MSDIPASMTAIEIGTPGPPEGLRPVSRPVPGPGAGEVLIRVAAAGVNRPDVLQRKGVYPPPKGVTDIPGLEIAGEVVRAGAGVTEPPVGARVCALVAGGGYAEY
ncbi:MAG: alcohol dehydrogenase catalytic domain-containing protein, partial [Steroidobacteraceae bacterium]